MNTDALRITIPVDFKPVEAAPTLTVTRSEAIAMMGLDKEHRSVAGQKKALQRFCGQHKIKRLPGGVMSRKQLEYHASGECRCRQ